MIRSTRISGILMVISSLFGCINQSDKDQKENMLVESTWMYESECIKNIALDFDNNGTIRVIDQDLIGQLSDCIDTGIKIDFRDEFLYVVKFSTQNFSIIDETLFYSVNGKESYLAEIRIHPSDFATISTLYVFYILPLDIINEQINVEIIHIAPKA